MTQQYLLEIGLEEVPARYLSDLSAQLRERVSHFLTEERVTFDDIRAFATPRRLAVIVDGISAKQTDIEEKVKGPSLKIAKDDNGEWTKAAEGFARGQGATTADLTVESIKGEDYVFVQKFISGEPVEQVLERIVNVIQAMTFPVSMRWNKYQVNFIRPIHWFVSLLDDKVIPFEFVDITADRISQGHRFLGQPTAIDTPATYLTQLMEQYVIADYDQRKDKIRHDIQALAREKGWTIPIDEDLLDEVTSIVEWPTVFYGDFEEKYLSIPKAILVTAMRDHQRYFYAENPSTGELRADFISVRNGDDHKIENVIRGNQKVLRARLEDALFFYEGDLNHSLEHYLEKLSHVNEHYKIGSFTDKQERVKAIVKQVISHLDIDDKDSVREVAVRAAEIYKFDLMTGIVDEFDELQGYMGGYYAEQFGESPAVAQAITTQYLPTTSGGDLPTTTAGAVLAMSDKLDTLIQFFNVGMEPTGSNDPYALRRQAMGILEIVLHEEWHLDISQLIEEIIQTIDVQLPTLGEKVTQFIANRLQPHLTKAGIDHDIILAIQHADGLDLMYNVQSALQLQALKQVQPGDYRQMMEALVRVANLGHKAELSSELDLELAESNSERQLMHVVQDLPLTETEPAIQLGTFELLIQPINHYFDNNMVNADDERIRANRYATMKQLTNYIQIMFDPRQIITKF